MKFSHFDEWFNEIVNALKQDKSVLVAEITLARAKQLKDKLEKVLGAVEYKEEYKRPHYLITPDTTDNFTAYDSPRISAGYRFTKKEQQ